MAILGLATSSTTASYWSEKSRRMIFHQYPQGKAVLMGLLSLMDDEETDKPKFGWWEERDDCIKTTTATSGSLGGGGAGPFANSAGTVSSTAAGFNVVANTEYSLFVADASKFVVYDLIWIRNMPQGTTATVLLQVKGTVTSVNTTTNVIKFRALEAVTDVSNDTDANSITVYFNGSSAMEGTRSVSGAVSFPLEIENYTQIFRHTIGPFSRTALKQGQRFDSSGIYKEQLHKIALRHMKAMELTAFRGTRALQTTVNADGDTVPEYKTGGVEWFLKAYETNATFTYRPGGSDVSASAWATTDEKRIIPVDGAITVDQFEMLVERAFRVTCDSTFEKVVLCGNGFLTAFNKLVKLCSYRVTNLNPKDTFGMNMTRWESPWGNLLFKTHPLLNETSAFRNDGYILDVGNIKYRPLTDSDTEVLKNRQNNDTDGRKDEILTEAGLEIRFPESHMFIRNVTDVTI